MPSDADPRGGDGCAVRASLDPEGERAVLDALAGKIEQSYDFQRQSFGREPHYASVKLTVAEAAALLALARRPFAGAAATPREDGAAAPYAAWRAAVRETEAMINASVEYDEALAHIAACRSTERAALDALRAATTEQTTFADSLLPRRGTARP
jgi:hypothetical protein